VELSTYPPLLAYYYRLLQVTTGNYRGIWMRPVATRISSPRPVPFIHGGGTFYSWRRYLLFMEAVPFIRG